jgi:TetR/AcrR family transcriptional regulator, transcriptional repressor for nem operon
MTIRSKRDSLIAAAKRLLWEHGYDAMSPVTVLQESGAGQGSLYHHFAGKMDLAVVALLEVSQEMRSTEAEVFARDVAPLERIRRFLGCERDGLRGCRLGRLANEAAIAESEFRMPVARYFVELEALVSEALREAHDLGQLVPTLDPEALASALVSVVQGGFVLSRIHRDGAYVGRAAGAAMALLDVVTEPEGAPSHG